MKPQIGDEVVVTFRDGFKVAHEVGTLGVELAADESTIVALVVENDGAATFIPRSDVIDVQALVVIGAVA